MVRHQIPRPVRRCGEDVGVLELLAVAVPPLGRPDLGVVERADDDGLPFEAGELAKALRDEDPTLPVELDVEGAGEQEPLEVAGRRVGDGQAADLVARSSQAGLGKIARHSSSQRATTAPPSSCARKRAGTARRPFASTVCRYSPVNTDPCHSLP